MSKENEYHSESRITTIILTVNNIVNRKRFEVCSKIEQASKVSASDKERAIFLYFAYEAALLGFGIILVIALVMSLVLFELTSFSLDFLCLGLYMVAAILGGICIIFYHRANDAKDSSVSKVLVSRRDLRKSVVVGSLIGIGFYFMFYGGTVLGYLYPR